MADYINKIRTTEGDKPVNYEALANKPNSLPNPNKIKFTGSVVAEYDGSSEVTVNIPNGASEEQAAQIQTNANDISELKNNLTEINDAVGMVAEITSNNKLMTNDAIGKNVYPLSNTVYLLGLDKSLGDYYDEYGNDLAMKITMQSTDNSINGVTFVCRYADGTDGSTNISVNTNYYVRDLDNYRNIVGFKIICYSVSSGKIVTDFALLFGIGNITDTADEYREQKVAKKIDEMESTVNDIKEKTALYGFVDITDFADTGVFNIYGNKAQSGLYQSISVESGDTFRITTVCNQNYPVVTEWKNGVFVGYSNEGVTASKTVYDYMYVVEKDIDEIRVNNTYAIITEQKVEKKDSVSTVDYINGKAETIGKNNLGKTAVWFGTSIPNGQYDGVGTSYPEIVAKKLGMTIINKAIGASSVRGGNFNAISENDPMGWSGATSMQSLGLAMSLSSAEKQAMFDNWDYWKTRIPNVPPAIADSMNDTYANMYKNASYDRLLNPYLDGTYDMPDAFIFDCGFNDRITDTNMELAEIPSTPNDRTYWIGAMRFLFDMILTANPTARIILIGHYESIVSPAVTKAQEVLAELYDLPLEKTWEKTGWNMIPIQTKGKWVDGYWQDNSLSTPVMITIHDRWLCDKVHPHSDKSGKATKFLADIHAEWLNRQII